MTLLRTMMRQLTLPEDILMRVNDELVLQNPETMFVTLVCAVEAGRFCAEPCVGGCEEGFSGFDADAECIEIFMPGAADPAGLNIAVRPSEDGRDALVLIDGHPTAILRGAPRATSRNVRLVTVAGVWAA